MTSEAQKSYELLLWIILQVDVLSQVLSGGGNVRHVLIQNVLLGADAVILDVLRPVQLANVKVEGLKDHKDEFNTVFPL